MATPVITTGSFPELLWPGLFDIWGNNYKDADLVHKKIFDVNPSKQRFEKLQQIVPPGLANIKSEGEAINYENPVHGLPVEFTHVVYGKGSQVTKEMFSDDLYREINKLPKYLARSLMHTEETVHANVLNNAFSATTGNPDGVTLINPSHPLTGTGGTLSNQPATLIDLTQTALETAWSDIRSWSDDAGLNIGISPKLLVVPPELYMTATRILESKQEVDTANNAINPSYNLVPHIDWQFLTDADAWFIITDAELGLMSFTRWPAEFERDNHFDTKNLRFSATKRWSQGHVDFRAIYGSDGSAS